MKELVLTVEQCRYLQELGVDMSDAKMCYHMCVGEFGCEKDRAVLMPRDELIEKRMDSNDIVFTYTVQELFKKIPTSVKRGGDCYGLIYDIGNGSIGYYNFHKNEALKDLYVQDENPVNLLYRALCLVIENKSL